METNILPLELLTNDNYADWSVKMKNNLVAQGLWDIVKIGSKPPKPNDDVVEFEAWRKMNDAALHTIQSSCGMDTLSRINKINSSKIAWKMLGKMFMESNGQNKQIQTEDDDSIIDEGNFSSSDNPDSGQDMPTGTGANQRVESGNSLDDPSDSNSSSTSSNGQDKLMQVEAVDPKINEGNSSSSHKSGLGRDECAALLKAVRRGDWNTTKDFLELHPGALTAKILITGGTVLHAAVDAEQEHIVEELVNMISEHDLAMQDNNGLTALHDTSVVSGNYRMAKCLITKNNNLVSIRYNKNGELPVSLAMASGHKKLARYLYSQTPFDDLVADPKYVDRASLFNWCILNRDLDMALDLMEHCPRLALVLGRQDTSPLELLANISTGAFESGKGMVFWKQWIYNHCIHISLARAADQFPLNIQNYQEKTIGSVRADLWRQLVSSISNLLGFKRLYEMKLVRAQFQQLLSLMCQEVVTTLNTSPRNGYIAVIGSAIFHYAIRRGNFEFVYHIVKTDSDINFWITDDAEKRSIFHWAVLHRQHRIFSLIYSLKQKNVVLNVVDKSKNSILHMAGMFTKNTPIDHIRGAALQMQREVQWFKEVERICPLSLLEIVNEDGLTARQLFTEKHEKMRKEGERWMKDTATSCTVVGALIITIMFTAAFTIPGGNNQDTGMPILVHDKLFTLFIVTDSVSLFSSTTSVLMFLGILTSRYAEEDFLRSLPRKMIIGLFALFFSITTMMIAFSAALLLMLREKYWTVVPIIGLAGIPVILFVLMQSRLLVDMFVSTYRLDIFDRKMKPWY